MVTFCSVVKSFNVECIYRTDVDWKVVGKIYYCDVQNDPNISNEGSIVTSVSGTQQSGKSIEDVLGIRIQDKTVKYFPCGLEKFFKNLQLIRIYSSKLKKICQNELKFFPNLVNLDLGANEIESLDEDLFKDNPKIQALFLYSNKIVKIHPTIFDNLTQLIYLYLDSNKCIDLNAENSSTQVINVIQQVKYQCLS